MLNLVIEVLVLHDDDHCWERVCRKFASSSLPTLTRFEAINGSEMASSAIRASLSPRAAYELETARRYPWGWVHEGVPTTGAIGCYLSHIELWKRAARRQVPTLILEQDTEPDASLDILVDALERIPQDVDLAWVGHLRALRPFALPFPGTKPARGFHAMRPSLDVFGTHAYLVTPRGARKLANRALPINAQVDAFMRFLSAPDSGINMVYHVPSLVRQRTGVVSTVQSRATTWHYLRIGCMMAFRAVSGSVLRVLSKPWFFLRERLDRRRRNGSG